MRATGRLSGRAAPRSQRPSGIGIAMLSAVRREPHATSEEVDEGLPTGWDVDLEASPAPWRYNPSAWSQRIPICLIAGVGFVIAVYMALYQWRLVDSVWDPVFGEQSMQVLDSDVSHAMRRAFGIPDAAFGAIAYLGDAIFGLAGSTRRWQYRPWMVMIFGLDVIPLGIVSAVLVVLQGLVVGAWCFLCLVTAVISLVLVYLAYDEVWSCLLFLQRVWRRSRSARVVWDVFWGRFHVVSEEVALQDGLPEPESERRGRGARSSDPAAEPRPAEERLRSTGSSRERGER